uniref:Carbohydrate sulfotransferase n=1 Tax=Ciona savignyi TaxID=51511 RepID=H2YJ15_CIOSA
MFVRWNSTGVLMLVSACFLFGTVALYFDGVTSIKKQAIWKEVPSLWFARQESGVKKLATYEQDEILNTTASTEPQFASFRFRRRIGHLRRVCEEGEKQGIWDRVEKDRRATNYVQNDNFLVLPDHNFLMCVLPKCGSSSWHWLVRDMRDPLSVGHAFGWQDRQKNTQMSQDLLPEDGDRLMQNGDAFRGISVRHPFGKLVSGWNDKLARGTTYGDFLLEAYPHMKEFASEKDKLHILSFEDFVEYIATYGDNVENLDYHFL